jgi:hypothetical protein
MRASFFCDTFFFSLWGTHELGPPTMDQHVLGLGLSSLGDELGVLLQNHLKVNGRRLVGCRV